MDVKNKLSQLRKNLEQHNYNYYVKAEPTISDTEYDFLMKELEAMEADYPEYYNADSPSQKVGGVINKSFESFQHLVVVFSMRSDITDVSSTSVCRCVIDVRLSLCHRRPSVVVSVIVKQRG